MAQITLKQLLEAGVHFGHQTKRWNPKMKKYIFGERNGIYIINLEITLTCLERALAFLKQIAGQGRTILMVGTKRQAQDPLREAAVSCEMPYVDQRWLGGMLTNFETVRKSVAHLDWIDKMEQEGNFQFITKKEASVLKKEREKLMKNLKGVRNMRQLPQVLFVIDSKKEEIAIHEAVKLGIPIVAVLDTNCDPDLVDYPLPGNDDAIRSVKLFCELAAAAIKEGRDQYNQSVADEEARQVAEKEREAAEAEEAAAAAVVGVAGETEDTSAEGIVEDSIEEKLAEKFAVQAPEDVETKIKPKKPIRKEGGRSKAK